MNEAILTQLKIIVERAVRPVQATAARKWKMREELLAHVIAVFEEESAKVGAEDAALERTIARFGSSAELTSQLQKSVSIKERVGALVERLVLAPDLSPGRRAVRHANLLLLLCMPLMVSRLMMALTNAPWHELSASLAVLTCALLGIWIVCFVGSLLVQKVSQAVFGPSERFWPRVLWIALLTSFGVPIGMLGLAVLILAVSDDAAADLKVVLPPSSALLLLPPMAVLFISAMIRRAYFGQTETPWIRTVVISTLRYAAVSLGAFALALLMSFDVGSSLKEALVLFAILMVVLLPYELALMTPRIRNTIRSEWRSDDEWANLRIS